MSLFLTDAEMQELTRRQKASAQIRWLNDRRWIYELDADGRPRVLRAHAMRKMGGVADRPEEPKLRLPS